MKMKRIRMALFLSTLLFAALLVAIGCTDFKELLTDELSSSPYEESTFLDESKGASFSESTSASESSVISDPPTSQPEDNGTENDSSIVDEEVLYSSSIETESSAEEPSETPHIHRYTMEIEAKPDCEITGINRFVCECGAFYREQTPALGHIPVVDQAIPSTCVKRGVSEGSHCERCSEILVVQEPLSLVHHRYEYGYCKVCNLVGLEFVINKTEGYATCTNYTSWGEAVRRVEIPDTYCGYPVKVLAPSLFEGCKDLYSVEIGENVEIIGEGAFHNCYHLVEIYDRSKAQVTKYDKIRNGALTNYAEDDDIHYEPFESEIEIIDDFVVFHDEGESVLLTYLGAEKSIVIPDGVTRLDLYCLWEYEIVEVTIPKSVNYIEKWAFYLCDDLKRVYFLDPDNWEAKGHDHSLCRDDEVDLFVENIPEWTPFAPGHLDSPEDGKRAIMDIYNAAYWRKTEGIAQ